MPAAADVAELRGTQDRLDREDPPLSVTWGDDGQVRFTVSAAKLLPEQNQIETTLAVSQLKPASNGSNLPVSRIRTRLREEIERTRQVPDLVDENLAIVLDDPGGQLEGVVTP